MPMNVSASSSSPSFPEAKNDWSLSSENNSHKQSSNWMISPPASLYSTRNSLYEYGRPITIGDNVWIGGNSVICPGVNIGSNVVIGAGSVVTKDIPDWCVAVGNPCRVLRNITEEDKKKLFKNEEIDEEAWNDIVSRGFVE